MHAQHDGDAPVPTVIGGAMRPARPRRPVTSDPAATALRVALLDSGDGRMEGLAPWLRAHEPDLDVVLTAGSWLELVHSPAFPTDLVVLDAGRHEPVSIEARIRTCRASGARVVVTGLGTVGLRERAERAGAEAALDGSASPSDVAQSLRDVMGLSGGGIVQRAWRPLPLDPVRRPRLSTGEEIALRLYASGRSMSEVAAEMHVQYETAKTYVRRIREKYARVDRPAGARAELVARASEDGYLR